MVKFARRGPKQARLAGRVDALEQQVRALTEIAAGKKPARDWRSTFGWARDDEGSTK